MEWNWNFRGVGKLEIQDWGPDLNFWGLFWGQHDILKYSGGSRPYSGSISISFSLAFNWICWKLKKNVILTGNPSLLSPLGSLLVSIAPLLDHLSWAPLPVSQQLCDPEPCRGGATRHSQTHAVDRLEKKISARAQTKWCLCNQYGLLLLVIRRSGQWRS